MNLEVKVKAKVQIVSQTVHCKRPLHFRATSTCRLWYACVYVCVSDLGLSFPTMQGIEMVNGAL